MSCRPDGLRACGDIGRIVENPAATVRECEWCGQPHKRRDPVLAYFTVQKWFHIHCFEAYADEVLGDG